MSITLKFAFKFQNKVTTNEPCSEQYPQIRDFNNLGMLHY